MAVLGTYCDRRGGGRCRRTHGPRCAAKANREKYIRTYMFPPGVFEKFAKARPGLDVKNQQLVARALRQFFLAYLKSGCQRVAMPSQVVDDLWHEFILFTRDYRLFCDHASALFLHHTPAVKMGPVMSDNEGLRRVWWYCCLEENINPRKATRLPLLFALDRKLGIADGFVYDLHCRRQLARGGGTASGSPPEEPRAVPCQLRRRLQRCQHRRLHRGLGLQQWRWWRGRRWR